MQELLEDRLNEVLTEVRDEIDAHSKTGIRHEADGHNVHTESYISDSELVDQGGEEIRKRRKRRKHNEANKSTERYFQSQYVQIFAFKILFSHFIVYLSDFWSQ